MLIIFLLNIQTKLPLLRIKKLRCIVQIIFAKKTENSDNKL